MAAPSAWIFHDKAKEKAFTGDIDYATDAFVMRLYASTSDIDTVADNDASTATDELSSGNGYSAGGTSLTPTVSEAGGVVTLDSSTDASWSATGAGITARFAAIICTTTTPDEIIAHCVLDNTPADVTAVAGKLFVVQFHANGYGLVT